MKEPFITLRDDRVQIDRAILKGTDKIIFLASGESGMYYQKDGKRTFVFASPTEFPASLSSFIFDTRAEIERFLTELPRLRESL